MFDVDVVVDDAVVVVAVETTGKDGGEASTSRLIIWIGAGTVSFGGVDGSEIVTGKRI